MEPNEVLMYRHTQDPLGEEVHAIQTKLGYNHVGARSPRYPAGHSGVAIRSKVNIGSTNRDTIAFISKHPGDSDYSKKVRISYNCDWKNGQGQEWINAVWNKWHTFPNGVEAKCSSGSCQVKNPRTDLSMSWSYWGQQSFMNFYLNARSGPEEGICVNQARIWSDNNADLEEGSAPYNGRRSIMQCNKGPNKWDVRHHGYFNYNAVNPGQRNPLYRFQQLAGSGSDADETPDQAAAHEKAPGGWGESVAKACQANKKMWAAAESNCVKAVSEPNFKPPTDILAMCAQHKPDTLDDTTARRRRLLSKIMNSPEEDEEEQDKKTFCDCMYDVCVTEDMGEAGNALNANEAAIEEKEDENEDIKARGFLVAEQKRMEATDWKGTKAGMTEDEPDA